MIYQRADEELAGLKIFGDNPKPIGNKKQEWGDEEMKDESIEDESSNPASIQADIDKANRNDELERSPMRAPRKGTVK